MQAELRVIIGYVFCAIYGIVSLKAQHRLLYAVFCALYTTKFSEKCRIYFTLTRIDNCTRYTNKIATVKRVFTNSDDYAAHKAAHK